MLNKLIVALITSAFALGAYAQAPKTDAKADVKAEAKAKTDTKAKPKAKTDTKAKAKAKSDGKAGVNAETKTDVKK